MKVRLTEHADRDVTSLLSESYTLFGEKQTARYAAIVGDATFGVALRAFTLSTSLSVTSAPSEPPYGTQALGRSGLCAELESAPLVSVPAAP